MRTSLVQQFIKDTAQKQEETNKIMKTQGSNYMMSNTTQMPFLSSKITANNYRNKGRNQQELQTIGPSVKNQLQLITQPSQSLETISNLNSIGDMTFNNGVDNSAVQ